ncbi:Peptidyl-prolyl cis-trans isomerase PASTICCINO1 [Acorus calamus]|uniref:peptidylprolyl isomerase n=1 Tax=Acorus calamus TaxID=4465 RepID=A0AAV9C5B0_ACOCL|nr:Peptidyl-prolyl cis-trans isomerase PASTICCINO1 [Acorus calamus]
MGKLRITAKTADGKLISTNSKEEPFFFTFGKAELPKGHEMGIRTMTWGEKAIVYVSSQYLTQSPFMPAVDGFEEILFDVELVHFIKVRDMLGDGRLIKRQIVDGKGDFPMDCLLHDSLLRVHYKGTLLSEEKTVFYETRVDNNGEPLEFSSGEGLFCYFSSSRPENVSEGAYVQWEIELLGFEMPKENRLFKDGKFKLAKAKYEKVLREYNHVNPQDEEEGKIFLNSRGFQIFGEAIPGSTLQACGYPTYGTSLCIFQWVRRHYNGTSQYVEGATNPEYVVTADDVGATISVERIPMDDRDNQELPVADLTVELGKLPPPVCPGSRKNSFE